jgi:hypothetical protein
MKAMDVGKTKTCGCCIPIHINKTKAARVAKFNEDKKNL